MSQIWLSISKMSTTLELTKTNPFCSLTYEVNESTYQPPFVMMLLSQTISPKIQEK
jgi:hypothetical protein